VKLGARIGTISIIVETCEDGGARVVVQGFLKFSWFQGASVSLDGFYKRPDGSVAEMTDGEFQYYG